MRVKQHAVQGESEGYSPKSETDQLTAKALSSVSPFSILKPAPAPDSGAHHAKQGVAYQAVQYLCKGEPLRVIQ